MNLIDKTLAFADAPALDDALRAKLQVVVTALLAKRPTAACIGLDLYIAAVHVAPAKFLSPAEKAELIADARRIKNVIGCS